jgi:hypothetical protein
VQRSATNCTLLLCSAAQSDLRIRRDSVHTFHPHLKLPPNNPAFSSFLFSSLSGLFPTLEQLQLLSVLLNLRVTAEIMHSFWADHSENEWGVVEEDLSDYR